MDSYKLAIIWGSDDSSRNIKDGQVERIGDIHEDSLHILSLLEVARTRFKDISLFQILNERHLPEVAAYIFTVYGHIVFLNLTKEERKYGKTGLFLMPQKITDKQKEAFLSMQEELSNYNFIEMGYNLRIVDGILTSDSLLTDRGNLEDLLKQYLEATNQIEASFKR